MPPRMTSQLRENCDSKRCGFVLGGCNPKKARLLAGSEAIGGGCQPSHFFNFFFTAKFLSVT